MCVNLNYFLMNILLSVIAFIILLAILVGFHEWGHLSVARANGVFCEIFSFGMGPKIFERTDKYGTKWRVSLFPIGGYVKMFGDADATSVREKIPEGYTEDDMQKMSAFRKAPWQRILIALGGPVANFVMAIILLFGICVVKGIPESSNEITVVSKNSLAYESGLRTKDRILKMNNDNIKSFKELAPKLKKAKGTDYTLTVNRNGETKTFDIKMYTEEGGKKTPILKLGIRSTGYDYSPTTVGNAFKTACSKTWNIIAGNVTGFAKIFKSKENVESVGGIISIFNMSVEGAGNGLASFVMTLAVLSAMLGAMNLLPIPCLDGGTVFINAIEWIKGKSLSDKTIEIIFTTGLFAVIGLMLLGLWNDITHLPIFSKIAGIFK